jgi:hypothetical protein
MENIIGIKTMRARQRKVREHRVMERAASNKKSPQPLGGAKVMGFRKRVASGQQIDERHTLQVRNVRSFILLTSA